MRKQLTYVAPKQTAKVMGLLWVGFTLPLILIMMVMIGASSAPNKPHVLVFLVFPVMYGICGYLFTLFGAWVYNQVAKRFGGIEYSTTDAQQGVPADRSNSPDKVDISS